MYYLSALIDNRKYQVVTLFPEHVTRPDSLATPAFIVERNPGEEKVLFSIDENAQLVFNGGFARDSGIDWGGLQLDYGEGEIVVNVNALQKGKQSGEAKTGKGDIRVEYEGGKYHFCVSSKVVSSEIKITIRLAQDSGHTFSGQFVIHLVPQQQIFDIVMDFGSEASQIVVHQRGNPATDILRRTNIIANLVNHFYKPLKDQPLHQQVLNDEELYSSQFFAKKDGSVFQPTDPAGTHGGDELLNLLTSKKDVYDLSQSHMFVSNLKLAHLGAYSQQIRFKSPESNIYNAEHKRFDNVVLDLQQAVINYFIQMILMDLKGGNRQGSRLYTSIRLLVPNVFDQQKVSLMVNKTYESLSSISERNSDYHLAGWEVSTISESDASFLGFKREKEAESRKTERPYWVTGRDYLIIDAGKGTIDFSILRMSEKSQLTSIFRSGFIGAGNVISYAFVDTIFTAIFGKAKENRQKAIYDICLAPTADMVEKFAFIELIEQFKQQYDQSKNAQYKPISKLIPAEKLQDIQNESPEDPTGMLKKIVSLLKTYVLPQGSLKDEFELINDTVDLMVKKIADEIRYSGFYKAANTEKIILTGRGFMFRRLERSVAETFGIPVDTTSDLKKICLTGAFSGDRINYDSNLVGYPTIYKFVTTAEKLQVRQVHKGENRPPSQIQVIDNIFGFMSQKATQFDRKVADMFSGGKNEFGDNPDLHDHDDRNEDDSEAIFLKGVYFDYFNKDTQTITVCGLDYKNHTIKKGRVNVFYTGNEFIIRSESHHNRLGVYPRFFEETQWVFQTLYPFIEVSGPSDVKLLKEFDDDLDMEPF